MAAMNYKGAIIASRAVEVDEDFYEDDAENNNNNVNLKYSHLIFKCFDFDNEICEWIIKLNENEIAEAVAIGNNWSAVATDFHYIRIFSHCGIEISCECYEKPIVAMAG